MTSGSTQFILVVSTGSTNWADKQEPPPPPDLDHAWESRLGITDLLHHHARSPRAPRHPRSTCRPRNHPRRRRYEFRAAAGRRRLARRARPPPR